LFELLRQLQYHWNTTTTTTKCLVQPAPCHDRATAWVIRTVALAMLTTHTHIVGVTTNTTTTTVPLEYYYNYY